MKTNKSYTKRLKITKNKKILARKSGQNHFNFKESSNEKSAKRKQMNFKMGNKEMSRFLVNTNFTK